MTWVFRRDGTAWRLTWPPEKPTATTPSSSGCDRNLDSIIEVAPKVCDMREVLLVLEERELCS